jgi:adenine-specific DNA-methyltransferase
MTTQKLELTWVGKNHKIRLEPRILIEDTELSYGDPDTGNMLIHWDNLLALRALEQDYAGKVKCIYIDPPYNTGNAFEHYDDGLEHSEWLNLMKPRLEILRRLLSDEGSIWISIDDKEVHYLKVLCDEVFWRQNYISTIAVKMSTASWLKTSHREKTIIKEKEFILAYAKNSDDFFITPQYVPKLDWDDEFQYILEKSDSLDSSKWKVLRLKDELKKNNIDYNPNDEKFIQYVLENSHKIWRRAFIRNEFKELSQNSPDKIFYDENNENYYYRWRQMYFYSDRFHECFTEEGIKNLPSYLLWDFWVDINTWKLFNEGGIEFRNWKKPEFLIARIFSMTTKKWDIVLDSFLWSGTTASVAHKMWRKYIGIELWEHAYTHSKARLDLVIDNKDPGGITTTTKWNWGWWYKFYELGPSVMARDERGRYVINPNMNGELLVRALCKIENFRYLPKGDSDIIKHGYSTERDFLHVTTRLIDQEAIDRIQWKYLKEEESILILAKTVADWLKLPPNIQVKKIPNEILRKCEYAKDDYSLPILTQTQEELEGLKKDIIQIDNQD